MFDLIVRAFGGDTYAFGILWLIGLPIFIVIALIVEGIKKLGGK